MVIMTAVGGENVTTTIEGRERYPVNVRYPRELRDDLEALRAGARADADVRRAGPAGPDRRHRIVQGPSMIRNENGFLAGYVYVDIDGRDVGGYVEEAKRPCATGHAAGRATCCVERAVREHAARAERLKIIVPITLVLIFCCST
jgi:copper/silver efflux system protein